MNPFALQVHTYLQGIKVMMYVSLVTTVTKNVNITYQYDCMMVID